MSNSKNYQEEHSEHIIFSPATGDIINIEDIKDPVFNQKLIGDGLAIKPLHGEIFSPCNGNVVHILKEKHAIFISCDDGTLILIHIGIDTVEMNGNGFNCLVEERQQVNVGDALIQIDLNKIKEHNKDDTIITLIINENNENIKNISFKNSGHCFAGKTVLFKYK